METVDEIWAGDLFGRVQEANDLIGYLESASVRPSVREDGHAHVLAVDTSYGQGKTFFLRRLDRHLQATEHVSAYVDAWKDDLENEPLIALASTLDRALDPWKTNDAVAQGVAEFKARAGRVAKIVTTGLLKRGIGFLITQTAAEAVSEELEKASDASKDIQTDALKESGSGLVENASEAFAGATQPSMDARIARFREGQTAIEDMKAGLAQVVDALRVARMKLPITIIVDELDRCRPTYAIKLLEEIKHLFDVPGIAFVLGLHGEQLAHSVSAAYGTSFDSTSYLRRFFNRRYTMKEVQLAPLVQKLLTELGVPTHRFASLPRVHYEPDGNNPLQLSIPHFISDVMIAYDLAARDAFSVVEILQTCMALSGDRQVCLTYLLPLIIGHIKATLSPLPTVVKEPRWQFAHYVDHGSNPHGRWQHSTLTNHVAALREAVNMSPQAFRQSVNQGRANPAVEEITEVRFNVDPKNPYTDPSNYELLLRTVSRFK